jgi:hypothetical protein
MNSVEVNDVNIAPLFSWSKQFEVTSNEQTTPVFMRILGDADMSRARVAALRRSAELRKKLKDLDSDERIAFIKEIDDISLESLVAVIVVFSMRDLTDKASKKLKIRVPKIPRSDAKTSVQEKYQAEVDSYPERRQTELRELLEKEVDILKVSLEKEGKEALYTKYITVMIDEMCERELLSAFKDWCCYFGSYKDESLSIRLFNSFEDFINMPPNLKQQFLNEYASMELYGDDLKKLQQVTP